MVKRKAHPARLGAVAAQQQPEVNRSFKCHRTEGPPNGVATDSFFASLLGQQCVRATAMLCRVHCTVAGCVPTVLEEIAIRCTIYRRDGTLRISDASGTDVDWEITVRFQFA